MKKIESGQTIYVTTKGMFTSEDPNLTEYTVTKVNTSSVYATKKGTDFEERFNKKTLSKDTGIGYIRQAYLNKEDYWTKVKEEEEVKELKNEISKNLHSLPIAKLIKIKEIIKQK